MLTTCHRLACTLYLKISHVVHLDQVVRLDFIEDSSELEDVLIVVGGRTGIRRRGIERSDCLTALSA